MKLSIQPSTLDKSLRTLRRRHSSRPRKDSRLQIKPTADGVILETIFSSAFLSAQAAMAGACKDDTICVAFMVALYQQLVSDLTAAPPGKRKAARV